ncbi:MAG: MBL fold metallo-hydrolase [Gammaproteobacteria bacterium]|nr:MBL fold metallo-hydrolase [Gammaproteobacteria bacterium]
MRTIALMSLLGVVAAMPALAQDFDAVEIRTTDLGGGIYMLQGAGGNLGLSVGEDGVFLIDDDYAPLAEKIRNAIAAVTDQPVGFLINTHWHGDHAGGNEQFSGAGAVIIAHDNARARLQSGASGGPIGVVPPAPHAALPIVTFADSITVHLNGHELHAVHTPAAHTDGDVVIYFEDVNVVHMGDVFFNGRYPFIDSGSGGSLAGFIAAQEAVLARVDDQTRIIPGHGPLASRADLERAISVLKTVRDRVAVSIAGGGSEDDAVAQVDLSDFNSEWAWQFLTGEVMTRQVYRELKAAQ